MLSNLKIRTTAFAGADGDDIKPHTSFLNYQTVAIAGLGSFLFGYANNAIAGSFAQTSFQAYFLADANADSIIGGILGGFLGGGLIGALVQAPISSKYGRKMASRVAALVLIVSGALMAGSVHIDMFLTARVINGIGAGMVITNCPVYMSEVSPPHSRGLLVSGHAITLVVGYIFSSLFALAFYFLDAPYAWRLQFVLLTFFGILLLFSLHFIPESPRWLVERKRHDEAWEVLKTLHHSKHDPEARIAQLEMVQIRAQVDAERSQPTGYIHIFRTPHLRKRAICCILVWLMGQSTGILVIANLTPTLFGGLGYSTVLQLGLSVVWTFCALIGCFVNAVLMDRVGRVKLLVAGGFLCSATLISEAVIQKNYLATSYQPGLKAGVAMYFAFILFYGSTIDCAAYVYMSEIWPTHLRSNGATIGQVSFFLASIAYNSPAALAFSTIGWKYYFVFVAVCLSSATFMLFYLPETAGLTLEEVAAQFGDRVEVEVFDVELKGEESGEAQPTTVHVGNAGAETRE